MIIDVLPRGRNPRCGGCGRARPAYDRSVQFGNSWLRTEYDADGRTLVASQAGVTNPDVGSRGRSLEFAYSPKGQAGLGAVFRSAIVKDHLGGGVFEYEYFYGANGQRRLKIFPTGARQEFFYSISGDLITDRTGNNLSETPDYYSQVNYVWLDGKPIAAIHATAPASATGSVRAPELCSRLGDIMPCGSFFPIADVQGKTAAIIGSDGKVRNIFGHDPYGRRNRTERLHYTAGPYPPNQSAATLLFDGNSSPISGYAPLANLTRDVRLLFPGNRSRGSDPRMGAISPRIASGGRG